MKLNHIAYILLFTTVSAHAGSKWDGHFNLKSGGIGCAQTLAVNSSVDGEGLVSSIDLAEISPDGNQHPVKDGRFQREKSHIADRKAINSTFSPLHAGVGPKVLLSKDNKRLVFDTKYGHASNEQCIYARNEVGVDDNTPAVAQNPAAADAPALAIDSETKSQDAAR